MKEPDNVGTKLEEHSEQLRVESTRISDLHAEIKEMWKIIDLLSEALTAETILVMGGGAPFTESDLGKANIEKLRKTAGEVKNHLASRHGKRS